MCFVACQKNERSDAATKANTERAARAAVVQAAVRKQSVVDVAQLLKDRMAQCTGDLTSPHLATSKLDAAAWARVERDKESSCTQLMIDLGSGKVLPNHWSEDQKAKFQRALNVYAKYAAQNMSRSHNEAMFMETVENDQDAGAEIERYRKEVGAQSVAFRDRGEKLFREAAKDYGVGNHELRLPDS
jgi:hypothetical protein